MKGEKIYILAPAFNEEESLANLLARVERLQEITIYPIQFVLVNDGSRDRTKEVFESFDCSFEKKLIDVQPNRGLANAMSEGLDYVASAIGENDVLVTLDADDSHNPLQIPEMLEKIRAGYDVIIASRFRPQSVIKGLTKFRKITGASAGLLFRFLIGLENVKDYTCGFRMLSGATLIATVKKYGSTLIEEKGFSCTPEILLKVSSTGAIMGEIPMVLRYDRKIGASKMNVSKTIKDTLSLIWKYKMGAGK